MDILSLIESVLTTIFSWPNYVILPIIFFIADYALSRDAGRAFKAGVAFGFGFFMLMQVLYLFIGNLIPIVENLSVLGVGLPIMDDGDMGCLTFNEAWGYHIFGYPIWLAFNFLLLRIGYTRTFDIDMWGMFLWATPAAMTYIATGNWVFGWVVFIIVGMIVVKLADFSAPYFQKQYGLPNTISFAHAETMFGVPFAYVLDKIYDRIPGLKDLKADPKAIRDKLGLFGDPTTIAVIVGVVMAAVAGFDVGGILESGIIFGAVMWILPECTGKLMEGLAPIAESVRERAAKWEFLKGETIYIGLDAYLNIGHPEVLATGLLLIPLGIALFNTGILPWQKIFVVTSITWWTGNMIGVVAMHRGNIVRSLITGIIVETAALWIANIKAPLYTMASIAAGIELEAGTLITNACTDTAFDFISLILNWLYGLVI